jgi:hypothetical protein
MFEWSWLQRPIADDEQRAKPTRSNREGRYTSEEVHEPGSIFKRAAVVYRFYIALRGVSPKIWRRVQLAANSSLADMQRVIQISLGWSDEYQHRLCIRHHYLGASRPGGESPGNCRRR